LSNLLSKHFGRVASVCTPHASVLSGDAFNHGLTRSRTDFSIYADPSGYNGTDLQAPLLLILPQFDSIPFIDGQKKSFWSMVETERGTGRAMLSVDWLHEKSLEVSAVFFDRKNFCPGFCQIWTLEMTFFLPSICCDSHCLLEEHLADSGRRCLDPLAWSL